MVALASLTQDLQHVNNMTIYKESFLMWGLKSSLIIMHPKPLRPHLAIHEVRTAWALARESIEHIVSEDRMTVSYTRCFCYELLLPPVKGHFFESGGLDTVLHTGFFLLHWQHYRQAEVLHDRSRVKCTIDILQHWNAKKDVSETSETLQQLDPYVIHRVRSSTGSFNLTDLPDCKTTVYNQDAADF